MSKPITITATRAVWMNEYHTPAELLALVEKGNFGRACDILWCYGEPDIKEFSNYTRMGEADVTIRLIPRDQQVALAVQALNDKLTELRTAYMEKQQQLLDQISKLQALPMAEVVEAAAS